MSAGTRRDGDTDFKFLARDTVPPYVDNRPMLVPGKPELREYIPTRLWIALRTRWSSSR